MPVESISNSFCQREKIFNTKEVAPTLLQHGGRLPP